MNTTSKSDGAVTVQQRPSRLLTWPEELERYFDRRFGEFPLRFWRRQGTEVAWLPDMDVFEKDGQLVIRTDLPGMTVENIDVTVEGDVLTIRGKREAEKEVTEEGYYCSERATGAFFRTIRLPEGVKADALEAHYDKGVLEVAVPKPEKTEAKSVKVEVK